MKTIEADYLIIGAGAVGMAFADVLLSETDARIVIVDKHHQPGGHWNDAYPFVTLHQPSSFYGVSSTELSTGKKDEVGLNKGLQELATSGQIIAYYDDVMKHVFLPSGRVSYFPMCEYKGDECFTSMLTGDQYHVNVAKKVIDGTYFKTSIPATHTPNFEIAKDVEFIALNDLPNLTQPRDNYVVVGGGKTAIDACLWLLQNNINPNKITWIMPRDGWLIDRKNTQSSEEFFMNSIGNQASQIEALAGATSLDDLFDRLEQAGSLLRLDPAVKPEMFHGATVSQDELLELQKIKNVVRKGRVTRLKKGQIEFSKCTLAVSNNSIFIDCSASAVPVTQMYKVFDGKTITVQTVRSYQPVFSAAFIAHIEANYDDNQIKNEICKVVPLPNHYTDWLTGLMSQMQNQKRWSQEPGLRQWLIENRLDAFTRLVQLKDDMSPEHMQVLGRIKQAMPDAIANMPALIKEAMVARA